MSITLEVIPRSPIDITVATGQRADLCIPAQSTVELKLAKSAGEPYIGEYTVTPSVSEIRELQTAQKSLKENVRVLKVPYFEVSNPAGGYTASIGV